MTVLFVTTLGIMRYQNVFDHTVFLREHSRTTMVNSFTRRGQGGHLGDSLYKKNTVYTPIILSYYQPFRTY